jgi:hypothetical protein
MTQINEAYLDSEKFLSDESDQRNASIFLLRFFDSPWYTNVVAGAVNDLRAHERIRMSSELRETFRDYTTEYIRLRKETNRLLKEGKIDKHQANHRNGNAKQFLMFARYQLEAAKKTNTQKSASSPHNWKLESEDIGPKRSGEAVNCTAR